MDASNVDINMIKKAKEEEEEEDTNAESGILGLKTAAEERAPSSAPHSSVQEELPQPAGQDEKHDWIASDKVEDKTEEMTEEELVTKNEVRKHFLQFMYLKIML